jgi:hypothetical protein
MVLREIFGSGTIVSLVYPMRRQYFYSLRVDPWFSVVLSKVKLFKIWLSLEKRSISAASNSFNLAVHLFGILGVIKYFYKLDQN